MVLATFISRQRDTPYSPRSVFERTATLTMGEDKPIYPTQSSIRRRLFLFLSMKNTRDFVKASSLSSYLRRLSRKRASSLITRHCCRATNEALFSQRVSVR
jgi:hypothetical protein